MTLHIVQLGPVPPPEGGVSRNIAAIRGLLASRGHRTTLVATAKSKAEKIAPDIFYPKSPLDLIATLRSLNADIAHLHLGGDVSTRVLLLALAVATLSKRSVVTMHSGEFAKFDARRNSVAGFVFRKFSRVIAVNEALRDVFVQLGVRPEALSVILPFALEPPPADVELPETIRHFATDYSPLFVAVGGCERDYEPFLLVQAFEQVRRQLPDARLIIVGGGSLENEVRQAVADSEANDSILLTGSIEHEHVLQLMDASSAVLRITLFDGDAISVREALYLGKPTIATDNGMRPDGVTLVPVGAKRELVDAMVAVGSVKPQSGSKAPRLPDLGNVEELVKLYEELASE